MAQLLMTMQKKYVPVLSSSIVRQIPLHGDQFFEERGRHVKWTFQDGDNPLDRLEGIETEFADWHGKMNTYLVSLKRMISFGF